MNELDNLKPEVRGAFVVLARAGIKNDALWVEAFNIIHAELVRLADQARTNLDMAACMDLLRRDCIAADAISESVPPMFYSEAVITLHRRAERAESELAALKRRIAESVIWDSGDFVQTGSGATELVGGKRYRLLLDDGESA